MTRLNDVHVPRREITETLILHIAATPAAVLTAADRVEPARDPFAGVQTLGERLYGLSWHPRPGAPGRIDVVFDLRIEQDAQAGCYLASTHRFTASDDVAREALLRNWSTIRANATAITRQTLRAIKRVAEEAPAVWATAHPVEVRLAA